jgi:5'-3' exonuclease
MITLIDADSIVYIVGWNLRERSPDEEGIIDELGQQLDAFVHGILQITQADHYAGYFSCPTDKCFRTQIATFKPYKGNRPEKPEWIRTWEPHIKKWLTDMWGFVQAADVEADDCVASVAHLIMSTMDFSVCIASNDKDLKQVPCAHYSYKTRKIEDIGKKEAYHLLWKQILTGDAVDGISGIPGIGKVKAEKILVAHDLDEYPQVVENEFVKYFGEKEGIRMFVETKQLVELKDMWWEQSGIMYQVVKPYDREAARVAIQNNPVYNQYYRNNEVSYSDLL